MHGADGGVGLGGVQGDRDLNLGGSDKLAVDADGGKGLEEGAGDAGVGNHTDAHDGQLGDLAGGTDGAGAELLGAESQPNFQDSSGSGGDKNS